MSAIIRSITVCVVLVAAIVSAKTIPASNVQQISNITIVKDIREFAEKHPRIQIVPMTRQEVGTSPHMSIGYRLGGRINGDRLVAEGAGTIDTPNVEIPLVYPENGNGSILTFIQIAVTQSNDDGNAYVEDGGIGQRFIKIILAAKNTKYFSFSVKYYGTD